MDRIRCCPPLLAASSEDLLLPEFITQEGFPLKLAYNTLLPHPFPELDLSSIWQGQIEPKIKFFMWLLWHDRISHRKLMMARSIVRDGGCPRCHKS